MTNADGTAAGGNSGSANPSSRLKMNGPAFLAYMLAKHYNHGLWKWIGDQCWPAAQPIMTFNPSDAPMWLGLIFYDVAVASTPPDTLGLPLNKAFLNLRTVNFRSSWTPFGPSNKDVRVWFIAAPSMAHNVSASGAVEVYRGVDELLPRGSTYINMGGASYSWYYDGWHASGYSKNTMTFCPAGSATPDTDGSQNWYTSKTVAWEIANETKYFPYCLKYVAQQGVFRMGELTLTDFRHSSSYGMAHMDLLEAYERIKPPLPINKPTSYTRKVCCIPGASPGQMTILIRDQFTTTGIDKIKWGFFCRAKPTVTSQFAPVTVAGTSSAGVMQYN